MAVGKWGGWSTNPITEAAKEVGRISIVETGSSYVPPTET